MSFDEIVAYALEVPSSALRAVACGGPVVIEPRSSELPTIAMVDAGDEAERDRSGRSRGRDPDVCQLRRADGRAQVQAHLPLRLLPVLLRLLLSEKSAPPDAARRALPPVGLDWPLDVRRADLPAPPQDGHPQEPRAARARHDGDAAVPGSRDRREVLRPDHLYRVPDVLLGDAARGDLPQVGRRRVRPGQDAEAHRVGHRVGPRIDHRTHRVHVRDHRRLADPVASARPAPGRRGVRPAEPALREVQGRGDDAAALDRRGRHRAPRTVRVAGVGRPRPLRRVARGRAAWRGRPVRLPERHADQPGDDGQPAGAHPHVGASAVHDGPVGDPAAVPAHPPADLHGVAVPRLVPGAEVRPARVLRRVQQPRRALPDPAAQGQRPRARGPRRRQRRRPPVGSSRRSSPARGRSAPSDVSFRRRSRTSTTTPGIGRDENASSRSASSSSSTRCARSPAGRASPSSSRVVDRVRSGRAAATNPSTSTPPLHASSGTETPSLRIRDRSSWDRNTLSYCGRNRIGAGTVRRRR